MSIPINKTGMPINMYLTYPLYREFPLHCFSVLLRFNCLMDIRCFRKS